MASNSSANPSVSPPAFAIPTSSSVSSTSSIVTVIHSQLHETCRSSPAPSTTITDDRSTHHLPDYFSQARESESIAPEALILADGGDPDQGRTYDGQSESKSRRRVLNQENWDQESGCGSANCNHGTYSDRPDVPRTSMYGNFPGSGEPGGYYSNSGDAAVNSTAEVLDDRRKMSTTMWLAKTHGIHNTRLMYLDYYFPFAKWIKQYKLSYLWGDLIAALTMASFYIPMSLSYASSLGHIPPINGLYSFVFNPLIYALLGTCPLMVVGPEAAGSLLTGNVVRDSIKRGHDSDADGNMHARIAGVVTGMAGAILLVAGGARLGFLDNVLSRPFLRGFISAIGVVILIDQLISEMGLNQREREVGDEHGSCLEKIIFLVQNLNYAHGLTCVVSFGSFAIIMVCRMIKKRLQPRFPRVAIVPDRFLVVVFSTIFTWQLGWDKHGLAILGDVRSGTGAPFPTHFPFDFSHMKELGSALSTSFVISLLGFFESSVAAKSLGPSPSDGIQGVSLSANRELVALGTANLVGGVFMALPAFGGYGRSKVNASTGGKTPMSSIFLSLITVFCILFALPWFYYIPKGVLSAMISVVAYSLIEEAPHDLQFFWNIRGWSELFLIFIVFAATVFYSLPLGIACGIGFSLLRVLKHSTRPRIQILGRAKGTSDQFENVEADSGRLEFIEGCLIVKIPEPLTFANTGDLKSRLSRLEDYGTSGAHPALPRIRQPDHNKNIIFDVHGVTSLDGAGAQVLSEIVDAYRAKGVRIFFCRVPAQSSKVWRLFVSSGIVESCGGNKHFVASVGEALRLTELESLTDIFEDGSP